MMKKRLPLWIVVGIFTAIVLVTAPKTVYAVYDWIQNGNNIYYTGGYVGIGTSSPAYSLDVAGDVAFTGEDLYLDKSGEYISGSILNGVMGILARGPVRLYTDTNNNDDPDSTSYSFEVFSNEQPGYATRIFGVTQAGDVSLGSSLPTCKLDVAGTIRSTGLTVNGTVDVESTAYLNGIDLDDDADIEGVDIIKGYNDIRFQASPSTGIRMMMYSNGDVCIGVCN